MEAGVPPGGTASPPPVAAAAHIDHAVAVYADACRDRIPAFIASHFSLRQTWELQRPTLGRDLLLGPINALWSIPYLTTSRICKGLDILGIRTASRVLMLIPPGVKTGYQRRIETVIARSLLDWGADEPGQGLPAGLVRVLEEHPELGGSDALRRAIAKDTLQSVFDQFLSARALVTDVAGAVLTLGLGWFLFDRPSLGLMGISEQLSRRNARSRAASRFFLGDRAGSVFYSVFRPRANWLETVAILAVLAFAIGAISTSCSVLFEPVRKRFGLHERRLHSLIDSIERELLVVAHRQIKPALAARAAVSSLHAGQAG